MTALFVVDCSLGDVRATSIKYAKTRKRASKHACYSGFAAAFFSPSSSSGVDYTHICIYVEHRHDMSFFFDFIRI